MDQPYYVEFYARYSDTWLPIGRADDAEAAHELMVMRAENNRGTIYRTRHYSQKAGSFEYGVNPR